MFGKLMKYELKNCLRKFAPIWGLILLLCAVVGLGNRNNGGLELPGLIGRILTGALPILALIAVSVAACVIAVQYICERYYKGLLGAEGYLMFTLPVSNAALIFAKLLTALIMEIVTVLVGFVGAMLMIELINGIPQNFFGDLLRGFAKLKEEFKGLDGVTVEWFLLLFFTAAELDLRIYAAISLGHLAKKNRVLWSVLAFVGLCIVISTLTGFTGFKLLRFDAIRHLISGEMTENAQVAVHTAGVMGAAGLVRSVILSAALFLLSHRVLRRKLNLE